MTTRRKHPLACLSICLLLSWCPSAEGQQAVPNAGIPSATSNAPPSAAQDLAAQRAEILESACWRRAIFELNEWFRTQTIYTPEEVAELRSEFLDRVDKMSVQELQGVISDMDAKFQILNSPEVQQLRAWFGQYLSMLADRRRDELLRDIPNFATMTPAQLTQEIMKIQNDKQQRRNTQAAFGALRKTQVDAQLQANRAAQAARQSRAAQRPAYHSPYRATSRERPFENVEIGPRRSMSVGAYGQFYLHMGF
jgi:hypothetical protein